MPRTKRTKVDEQSTEQQAAQEAPAVDSAVQADIFKNFAEAIIKATEAVNGPRKKTILNRTQGGPFAPKNGIAKPKFRVPIKQHGNLIIPETVTDEEIHALNQLRPGRYLNGFVEIEKVRGGGLNIKYPTRTAAQKMRLSSEFGVNCLLDLCARIMVEAAVNKSQSTD